MLRKKEKGKRFSPNERRTTKSPMKIPIMWFLGSSWTSGYSAQWGRIPKLIPVRPWSEQGRSLQCPQASARAGPVSELLSLSLLVVICQVEAFSRLRNDERSRMSFSGASRLYSSPKISQSFNLVKKALQTFIRVKDPKSAVLPP